MRNHPRRASSRRRRSCPSPRPLRARHARRSAWPHGPSRQSGPPMRPALIRCRHSMPPLRSSGAIHSAFATYPRRASRAMRNHPVMQQSCKRGRGNPLTPAFPLAMRFTFPQSPRRRAPTFSNPWNPKATHIPTLGKSPFRDFRLFRSSSSLPLLFLPASSFSFRLLFHRSHFPCTASIDNALSIHERRPSKHRTC